MLVDVDFLTQPSAKIVNVEYSWSVNNQSSLVNDNKISVRNLKSTTSSVTIKVITENVSDGINVNFQLRRGFPYLSLSRQVVNNECIFEIPTAQFTERLRGYPDGTPYYMRFSLNQNDNVYPWNDYVLVLP